MDYANEAEAQKTMEEIFGEPISVYTAQQAEEDGYLINVTEMAKEAGFKWTVRITNGVHSLCKPPKSNKIESYDGRLWDVLYLAFMKIKSSRDTDGVLPYKLKIGKKTETLWITIDGTMGEPAIHIIKPDEY